MKLYIDIITEHSKVVKVGLECQVIDWMRKEKETFTFNLEPAEGLF